MQLMLHQCSFPNAEYVSSLKTSWAQYPDKDWTVYRLLILLDLLIVEGNKKYWRIIWIGLSHVFVALQLLIDYFTYVSTVLHERAMEKNRYIHWDN